MALADPGLPRCRPGVRATQVVHVRLPSGKSRAVTKLEEPSAFTITYLRLEGGESENVGGSNRLRFARLRRAIERNSQIGLWARNDSTTFANRSFYNEVAFFGEPYRSRVEKLHSSSSHHAN